ncbi:MAG: methyltransferase domain-containing protein [Planctomycetes bacterium]|jgi:SAM-dependent methyltransferase|nr:methyltransferase domain-containing protein [Planctomycetota bacterium]
MSEIGFNSIAERYDLLTDWERRLPREMAFLSFRLKADGAGTVLDAACGTGMHLAELARLGYRVTGADLSPEMVMRARERLPGIEVHALPFDRVGEAVPPQDAVLVLGNSLPLAGTAEGVGRSLTGLFGAVRPGGLLVLHMLNYPKLRAAGGGLLPVRRVEWAGREILFLKLFEVHEDRVVLDLVVLEREGERIRSSLSRSDLWPATLPALSAMVRAAGGEVAEALGSFGGEPYDEARSADLIVVARRRE